MGPLGNRTTIASMVTDACRRHAAKAAVIDGDKQLLYRDIDDRSNRLANALLGQGLKKGDHVGILSSNRHEYIEIDFALAKAGLVRVPLYTRNAPEEHRHFIEDADLRGLIFEADLWSSLMAATDNDLSSVVPVLVALGDVPGPCAEYEDVLAGASSRHPGIDVQGSDPHQIRYTAGSTGRPKGALSTHTATVAATLGNVYHGSYDGGLTPDDSMLHISPFSHSAGFFVPAHSWVGMTHIIMHGWDPERFLQIVEKERATSTVVVPTMISMLLEDDSLLDRYDTSSLRSMIYTAAPITVPLLERALEQFGPILSQGWGLTEAPSLTTLLPARDHRIDRRDLLSSCGFPLPWVHLEIHDPAGNKVPTGELGEITVAGQHVMTEYINSPQATREAVRHGRMYSGDMGVMDERGYVHIKDRKSFMIISGGFNVYPAEVERALASHESVVESSVIGIPDDKWGEIVCAVVRLIPGSRITADELGEHCKKTIAPYKRPRKMLFVNEPLPRSEHGKIMKREIRDLALRLGGAAS